MEEKEEDEDDEDDEEEVILFKPEYQNKNTQDDRKKCHAIERREDMSNPRDDDRYGDVVNVYKITEPMAL